MKPLIGHSEDIRRTLRKHSENKLRPLGVQLEDIRRTPGGTSENSRRPLRVHSKTTWRTLGEHQRTLREQWRTIRVHPKIIQIMFKCLIHPQIDSESWREDSAGRFADQKVFTRGAAMTAWTSLAVVHSCGHICQAVQPGDGIGYKVWPPVHRTIRGPGSRLAPA